MSEDELSLRIIGVDQGDQVGGARQLKLRTTRGEIPIIVHAAETPRRAVLCVSGAIGGFDGSVDAIPAARAGDAPGAESRLRGLTTARPTSSANAWSTRWRR